jgi:hypothetical protein
MTAANNDTSAAPRGFDSPVVSREDDHLNRWPLAREIVGIATTGPKTWSVRVGIYGEWGTGKTSVLRFVDSMASQAGHIVIWFDPWEYSNKAELWQAFVLAVYRTLEAKLGQVPGADDARFKSELGTMKKVIGTVLGAFDAGKAINAGLDLLKKHFAFSPQDLASLQSVLGAFDPIVVGEVLGDYHPGFGDGLKFLEKIIDYPRWLPPAPPSSLVSLALAQAKRSCPYVPEPAIRDAIPLLPANPRTVRQFIRLLALLKPQIERHRDDELNWPVILAANVLKIRHPRMAQELLSDEGFWNGIGMLWVESHAQEKEQKLDAAVSAHVQKAATSLGLTLEESHKNEIGKSLKAICSHVAAFMGLDPEGVGYQVNIADAPAAVTLKEFEAFLPQWESRQTIATAQKWITDHAKHVDRSETDVYRELLRAAAQRYAKVLHSADNVLAEAEKPALVTEANSLLALLNALVFDLGQLNQPAKQIGEADLDLLVDKWTRFAGASLPVHTDFWPRNEAFILDLFDKWSPDVMPLIRILGPYTGIRLRSFDHNAAAADLHNKLCAVALPKFARQIISGFRDPGFIERLVHNEENTFEARCMMWDAKGALWGTLRNELLKVLAEAPTSRSIQSNAYALLHWFVLRHEGQAPGDPKAMQTLLSDQVVFDALWSAAIATPLAPRGVHQIRTLPGIVHKLGTKLALPSWWIEIAKTFIVPAPANPPLNASTPAAPEQEAK